MPGPALTPVTAAPVAGWYGKIPALGDFASRRLPPAFVDPWDAWLQRALAASRAGLREHWQGIYLNSPIWRFALFPGVCGDQCWAGVMMPSVDKVGRQFPLTIAAAVALAPQQDMVATVFGAQDWYDAVERIALSSLSLDFTVEDLEGRLAAAPFACPAPETTPTQEAGRALAEWWAGPGRTPLVLDLPDPETIAAALRAGGIGMLSACGAGKSLWWMRDEPAQVCRMHGFSGLPPEGYFANLLAGMAAGQKSL